MILPELHFQFEGGSLPEGQGKSSTFKMKIKERVLSLAKAFHGYIKPTKNNQ